jgi:hypothetical protein
MQIKDCIKLIGYLQATTLHCKVRIKIEWPMSNNCMISSYIKNLSYAHYSIVNLLLCNVELKQMHGSTRHRIGGSCKHKALHVNLY